MTNHPPGLRFPVRAVIIGGIAILVIAACGATSTGRSVPASSATQPTVGTSPTGSPNASPEPASPAASEPDSSTGTTSGDVPDNAVFLTYADAGHGFSVQYVEGWQVVPSGDGVSIHDKDSRETIAIVPAQADVAAWVNSTDLPALRAETGFNLIKQDTVKVRSATLVHLSYHLPAPPNPVTGKQVPSTIDRYYVPGATGLAVVSLSTPDGVDNVDAFRQMIESFKWS
jgi:hypothetical protein